MRLLAFATRNRKEILRDPLSLLFGAGLPLALLWLLSALQRNIPAAPYRIENLAPGIAVFSYSFLSLFSGMLIAKDRSSSFLMRLFSSPLTPSDYILGYTLPIMPISLAQSIICFVLALSLGLGFSTYVLATIAVLVPIGLLYVAVGLLLGILFTDKQVGGIFAIFVNLSAWLSGTWFDLSLIGGTFEAVSYALPFAHAVAAARATLAGETAAVLPHLLWVLGYTIILFALAVCLFRKKAKS
jgi:ABC-2 type transport system permease protein